LKDIWVAVFLISGTFFLLVGSLGIWRMPDLYCRMHAQTKGSTLGIIGILIAATLYLGQMDIAVKSMLTIVFQLLTSATGAHLMSRAAHRQGVPLWSRSLGDDLK